VNNVAPFVFYHSTRFLLICGGAMEMVLDYGGAKFLGCVMLCFFFVVVVFSWSMDAIGGLGLFSFIAKVGG
jgi:hypothetical protein